MDAAPSSSGFDTAALFPFCRLLRSKKLYFARQPPRTEEEILDASRRCWCSRTMQALGPDGELVAPEDCRSGRTCFEGFL